ncbi:hypothetical protein Patl1_22572 [Pistacia atlantica]|uniref:Uncharacterized protein n=1 Tax=Pistacia atlantica TaxID=434234 RepID=A0ACC0ZV88_9ROSI|nr:hypothetical protein Patl1_22572 [Pistacia atlantica]
MDYGRLVFAIIGFSSSFFLCLPSLKRWHRHQISQENLRLVTEALDQAEEMMVKFQERHDRILNQICSYYMVNEELLKDLGGCSRCHGWCFSFCCFSQKYANEDLGLFIK